MKHVLSMVAVLSLAVLAIAIPVPAEEGKPAAEQKPAAASPEVTLKGVMMLEAACTLKPAGDADNTLVLFALEGTPRWQPHWTPS